MSNTKLKTQHSILNSLLLSVKPIHTAAITAHPTPTTPTANRIHTAAITAHRTHTITAHLTLPGTIPTCHGKVTTEYKIPTITALTAHHHLTPPGTITTHHGIVTTPILTTLVTTITTVITTITAGTAHPITTTAIAMVTTLVTEAMTPTMERTGMSTTTRKRRICTTGPWLKIGLAKSFLKMTKINLMTSLVKLSLS